MCPVTRNSFNCFPRITYPSTLQKLLDFDDVNTQFSLNFLKFPNWGVLHLIPSVVASLNNTTCLPKIFLYYYLAAMSMLSNQLHTPTAKEITYAEICSVTLHAVTSFVFYCYLRNCVVCRFCSYCYLSTFRLYVRSCDCHIVSLSDIPLLLLRVSILVSSCCHHLAVLVKWVSCKVGHVVCKVTHRRELHSL